MSVFSQQVALAAQRCLDRGTPFALYAEPGSGEFRFQAAAKAVELTTHDFFSSGSQHIFALSRFDFPQTCVAIADELSAEDILTAGNLGGAASHIRPVDNSTTFHEYLDRVVPLIVEMRDDGSKTVVSRLICAAGESPVEVASRYFAELPATFRYLCYTPQTGIWLGATPELLCEYSPATRVMKTMSLAGTRAAGCAEEWDAKNIAEHNYVTEFIKSVLQPRCAGLLISAPYALRFGAIEHLCEAIEARGVDDAGGIVATLSPTPAVCGTPRPLALGRIAEVESHSRHCYGGWIGIGAPGRSALYVNLRCALAGRQREGYTYNIYAGGGVTGQSDATAEWCEADAKAAALLSCLR